MESEDAEIDPKPYRPGRSRLIVTAGIAATILAVLVLVGVVPRLRAATERESDREREAGELAHVTVELPAKQAPGGKVALPGTVQAVQDAVIYARTTGYVRTFTHDIGDTVKAKDVLATLDTPDVDQELRAAEAATQQAAANIEAAKTQLALASTESNRYTSLAGSGVVSKQDMEEHVAGFDARGANLKAIQAAYATSTANLQRLRELKSFATVTAPFDGVVTTRTVEIGQLVAAGISQPMFHVANTSVMRIYVNVPQVYAPAVKNGDDAVVHLREYPNRVFTGKVTRSSGALDPATRTLLTEIRIPNPDGALLPGMYAELQLAVSRVDSPLMIRPSSLVADANGTRVAIVAAGKIHWQEVKVDSDLGDKIAVLSGLKDTDKVVIGPSERLTEGLGVTADVGVKK
jgi:RND family efflux transporter MFP subunit